MGYRVQVNGFDIECATVEEVRALIGVPGAPSPSTQKQTKQAFYVKPPPGRQKRAHGAGSIFNRGGLWSVRYLDADGKRRVVSRIPTEEKAEEVLAELLAKRADVIASRGGEIAPKRSAAGKANAEKRWGKPDITTPPPQEIDVRAAQAPAPKRRRQFICRKCGNPGHMAKTCVNPPMLRPEKEHPVQIVSAAVTEETDDQQEESAQEEEAKIIEVGPREHEAASASGADALSSFLSTIARYPMLSREEEHQIAVQYRETGDPKLLRRLVTANLRYVVRVAKKYRNHHDVLDLIQEGSDGLIAACKTFDPSMGTRLLTIADHHIHQRIQRHLLYNKRVVRLKEHNMSLLRLVRKSRAKLGQDATQTMVAADIGVPEEKVRDIELRFLPGNEVALDTPLLRGHEDGPMLVDAVPASDDTRPDVRTEEAERSEAIKARLREFGNQLTGRELEIFNSRLLSDEPLTLSQVAHKFYLSRERIRQIEDSLKKKIREYMLDQFEEESLGVAAAG